jgi:hypothetical protein
MSETSTIQDIVVVKCFKCLGTVINNTDNETLEIKTRVLAANNTYSSSQTIFRSKQICKNKIILNIN